jgi:DNA primase small subunit
MMMRKSTPEERAKYYKEEWNRRDLPDFILHTLSLREFGFDLDGSGPSNRYNQFMMVERLEDFLKNKAPYSAYASVAMYERPSKREGWLKAELVFDIDAKDLPQKPCSCQAGEVCEKCINEARKIAGEFAETLKSDLGIRNINFVYSGRGFHIRINDDSVMELGQSERGQIVNYLTGAVVPSEISLALGYSKVFRERVVRTLEKLDEKTLLDTVKSKKVLQRIMDEKSKVFDAIRRGKLDEISSLGGIGTESLNRLMKAAARLNAGLTDGKVTVDTKRILRLPSSLHSGVSMKCTVVKNLDNFNLEDAVPKFLRESAV